MPFWWIQLPFGVSHLATVNFQLSALRQRISSLNFVPLPKVVVPTNGILDDSCRARDDFRCTGTSLINKQYAWFGYLEISELAITGHNLIRLGIFFLRLHDDVAVVKEHIADFQSLIQQTAWILPEIKHKRM